jgi:uncharacterized membrane protein YkgB
MPKNKSQNFKEVDLSLIAFFSKTFLPFARFAIFLIFFWFGLIKLIGVSSASPLAQALISKTVGVQYFDTLFYFLAAIECVIGILILFPRATRIVIPLLLFHMVIVCSPLILLPDCTWQQLGIPTLEGQYIIKNAAVVAVAIGIAASAQPLKRSS